MSAVYARNVLLQHIVVVGASDAHPVLGLEMEGGRNGHIQVVVERIRGGNSITDYDVISKIDLPRFCPCN